MARGKVRRRGRFQKIHQGPGVPGETSPPRPAFVKTEDYRASCRPKKPEKKIAQNPNLAANVFELADTLSDLADDQDENEAIALLENKYKATSDFSYQQRAGVLRMKQLRRRSRKPRTPSSRIRQRSGPKAASEQLSAELDAWSWNTTRLCVENYPTDLSVKLRIRASLLKNGRYNEAIPLFQEAQRDPRRKIAAMNQVGYCFFIKAGRRRH